jgi:hypothetical protein
MGDSAIVAAEQMCAMTYGVISTGVNYLLRKKAGKWKLDRPISGWTSPLLGMVSGRFLSDDVGTGKTTIVTGRVHASTEKITRPCFS